MNQLSAFTPPAIVRALCATVGGLAAYMGFRVVMYTSLRESAAAESVSRIWESATPDVIASRVVYWHTSGLLDGMLLAVLVYFFARAGVKLFDGWRS